MPTTVDIESQRMLLGTTPVRKLYYGASLIGTRIAELFANGEQGVWYDPSDLSTLFQDSAGTLPVTAMEQPVGLMLDKSGRGNHAVQATTTARPVVSARYNLLTQTEDFSHPDWSSSFKFTYAPVAAPDGTLTAQELTSLGLPSVPSKTGLVGLATGVQFTIWLKAGTLSSPVTLVRNNTTATNLVQLSFTGSVSNSYGTGTTQIGENGWVKHTIQITSGISPGDQIWFYYGWTGGVPIGQTFSVWRPDVRAISDTALPDYQRVTSATDYDTAGFPVYLKPDGVDDFMQTVQNVNLSGTAKMSAVIGLTKLTDALRAIVYEHGTSFGLLGNFSFEAPGINANPHFYAGYNGGSGAATIARTGISATATLVGTLQNYLDTPWRKLAANKLVPVTNTVDNGAGPFSSTVAYLFSRTGTQHRFAGRFYGLLIVGRACSDGEMNSIRQYMRSKTRAY